MIARVLPRPRNRSRAAVLALLALAPACRQSPAEPSASPPPAPAAAPQSAERYRPPLEESGRRIAAAVAADGGAPAQPTRVVRLDSLAAPPSVDTVAARLGDRWVVAAVEPDRVTLGLAGAERIYNLLNERRQPPSAVDLARIVGAFHYYPWRVYDGSSWSRTVEPTPALGAGSVPMLTPRPGGTGRTLTFSFWIPEGQAGAGMHVANLRVTDSGLLIDEAPDPSRR